MKMNSLGMFEFKTKFGVLTIPPQPLFGENIMTKEIASRPIYITDHQGFFYIDCSRVNPQLEKLQEENRVLRVTIEGNQKIIKELQIEASKSFNKIKCLESALASPPPVIVHIKDLKAGDRFTFADNTEDKERRVYIKLGRTGRMLTSDTIPEGNSLYMNEARSTVSYCSESLAVYPQPRVAS